APPQAFGDDDRVATVRREVEVVRISDRHLLAGLSRKRVDRREAVAGIVVHPERLEVVRRSDVLWQRSGGEMPDDPEAVRIDLVDRVAAAVRHVDPLGESPYYGAQPTGPVG